jgi:hypothetical protein
VWNLLYNKNQAQNYKAARTAAEKIRIAKDRDKAIETHSGDFMVGMVAWAKDDEYLSLIKEVHRLFKKSPYAGAPTEDKWIEVPGLESYARSLE